MVGGRDWHGPPIRRRLGRDVLKVNCAVLVASGGWISHGCRVTLRRNPESDAQHRRGRDLRLVER